MGRVASRGRAVLLCGGSPHAHDFDAIAVTLRDLFQELGFEVARVDHPDELGALLEPSDLLVVHGLWWRMHGAAYDEWRPGWGYSAGDDLRHAIRGHLAADGALLAMHTAPICFDDWSEWGEILGGAWVWGESSHPPPRPVTVRVVEDRMIASVSGAFEIVDEVYGDLRIAPESKIIAVSLRHEGDRPQPIVWTHLPVDGGRVACDLLGHDDRSLGNEAHRRLLADLVERLTRTSDADRTTGAAP